MSISSSDITKGILQAVLVLVVFVLFAYFVWSISTILIYLVLGFIVSLVGSPMVKLLVRIKIPKVLSVIITMLLIFGIIIGLISFFIPLFVEQSKNLSLLDSEIIRENVDKWINETDAFLQGYNIKILENVKDLTFLSSNNWTFIPSFLELLFGIIGNLASGVFAVLFISFFFLKDDSLMVTPIINAFSAKYKDKIKEAVAKIQNLLSRYFIGLILQVSIMFILYFIILSFFPVENTVAIAFLCAFLNLIPYIGPLVGAFLIAYLSFFSMIGAGLEYNDAFFNLIYILICYGAAQLFDNLINQPIIFSNSVKSHPLEIFIIILIGGTLFGVIGLLSAVPIYTIFRVIVSTFFNQFKLTEFLIKNFE